MSGKYVKLQDELRSYHGRRNQIEMEAELQRSKWIKAIEGGRERQSQ
jgi:hypothetical protein